MSDNNTLIDKEANLASYRDEAKTVYKSLVDSGDPWAPYANFKSSVNYWQVGCVFDTITDYLLETINDKENTPADTKQYKTDAQALVKWADGQWGKTLNKRGGGGCWYDDFGWWGIASAKAKDRNYADVFGPLATKFGGYADLCYDTMANGKKDGLHFGAPLVWEKRDPSSITKAHPLFETGGVWQYDIFTEKRKKECGMFNPATPIDVEDKTGKVIYSPVLLGPYQLTVVNGLYLILGQRLGNDLSTTFDFLNNWVYDPKNKVKKGHKLLNSVTGLIRERVGVYQSGETVAHWSSDTSWGGDQGLILGGMVDYIRACNNATNKVTPNTNAQKMIDDVIAGVCKTLKQTNGSILPWYPLVKTAHPQPDSFPQSTAPKPLENSDYPGGSGIFMCYFLYAYKYNDAVKTKVGTPKSDMRNLLFDAANACVKGDFIFIDNYQKADKLWDHQNRLAILTMAIHVLSQEVAAAKKKAKASQ